MQDPGHVTQAALSRRSFLRAGVASALLLAMAGCGRHGAAPRVGVALGGGGARGLAHIPLLETLDELGVRPAAMAGTSIGSIIGALYAAGMTGKDIRAQVEQFFIDHDESNHRLFALPKSLRWLDFIDPGIGDGGLLNSDDFIHWLGEILPVHTFSEMHIPIKVVTAELLSGRQVVMESGELLPAIQASMAVPGVFAPVSVNGRLLVDGGVANPLPYDLLQNLCDLVIAIDVSGSRSAVEAEELSSVGVLLMGFQHMSNNMVAEKLRHSPPSVYIRPDIRDVRMLEFYKARQVFEQSRSAQQELRNALKWTQRTRRRRMGCSMI